MRNPICILRTIWRSFLRLAYVSGHNYATDSEETPANVHVLRCETCGKRDVTWSWDSLRMHK